MTVEINLTQKLQPETIEKLKQFLNKQTELGAKLWNSNTIFKFADGTEFYFTHPLFQRKSKKGQDELRYEILSLKEPLGKGSFGEVFQIEGTLKFNEDGLCIKKQGKDGLIRVMKLEAHSNENPIEQTQKEYELAKAAGHLAVKEPILVNNKTLMVMNFLPGESLFDIIENDYEKNTLTIEQRFKLTEALLKALKAQVTSKGIVHRDIKPENIFVDLQKNPIEVNFLDFGLGFFENAPDGKQPGTREYVSPEILKPYKVGFKSDVYSLGLVIAKLWGADESTYDPQLFSFEWPLKQRLINLFNGLMLPIEQQNEIRIALSGMLKTNPEHRYSIDQAISKFPSCDMNKGMLNRSLGQKLSNLISNDCNNKIRLTMEQRFKLGSALLEAVKEQVTSKERVHCALNPSNIFVNLTNYNVTILNPGLGFDHDMGFAGDIPEGEYLAPELIQNPDALGYKADVFSIGLIIARLFAINLQNLPSMYGDWPVGAKINLYSNFSIFEKGAEIPNFLVKMLEISPQKRYSIDQAIDNFPNSLSICRKNASQDKENVNPNQKNSSKNPNTFFKPECPNKRVKYNTDLTFQKLSIV